MEITLYQNVSERINLSKTLNNAFEISGVILKDNTSILSPSLILTNNKTDDNLNIFEYNYLYIPAFKRYYYIDNIIQISNKMWQIDCSVDVLMSFKDKILLQTAFIERNENEYNTMLVDDMCFAEQGVDINYYVGEGFNNPIFGAISDPKENDCYFMLSVYEGLDYTPPEEGGTDANS